MPIQNSSIFAPVTTLPGITKVAAATLTKALGIKTIEDLAESPHFLFAAEILVATIDPGHTLHHFGIPKRQALWVLTNV